MSDLLDATKGPRESLEIPCIAPPLPSAVRLRCALVGLCLVSTYACGESPSAPSGNAPELAITGTDPAPDAPGIFLGTDVTSTACLGNVGDGDNDGLLNRCEAALAAAFAPELNYSSHTPATATFSECYWTEKAFGGWQDRTPKGSPYSSILSFFGFESPYLRRFAPHKTGQPSTLRCQ